MSNLDLLRAQWPAISARLDEALALSQSERIAWLDALPETDPVKDTLRVLLADAAHVETADFLQTLPRLTEGSERSGRPSLGEVSPGASVGPYRILSALGHGGMGAVWLAERIDDQPRRRIALKLPHFGWAPGWRERLARERDILASLEHPNIARLYDAGVDALGRPYLALECVDGTPIDRYCSSQGLTLRQRLELVLQVAAAVAHAHSRLVVHRDLKPSNILVTPAGEVRLLDFGIAKLLQEGGSSESTELTGLAGRPLTPDYASPEQMRGEAISTASDVYSLGVVVYELLSGARPFQQKNSATGGARVAPLASHAATDPVARRQLSGDLDAILNKALKDNPAERYPTVVAFADDIERHLRNAPVSARPDRLGYRARKFLLRNALQVSAAALVLIALLAGAGVALWQAHEARAEAARAQQVKDFALSIFEEADTDSGAGVATTAVDLLKAAQARVARDLAGRPLVATELMTAIGYSLLGQGKADDAAEILREAIAMGERELGAHHLRTVAAKVVYGEALVGLGRSKEAIGVLSSAAGEARRQGAAHELIDALRWLGSAQIDAGDVEAGIASSQQAVAVLTSPLADKVTKLDASGAWASLANALAVAERPGQVEAARHALGIAREVYGERLSEMVMSQRMLLADGLAKEGHVKEALAELSTLLADSTRILGPFHSKTAFAAFFFGTALLEAGDVDGAIDAYRTELAIVERTGHGGSHNLGMAHYHLASALAAARLGTEALREFETAAQQFSDAGGPSAALALRSRSARAGVLTQLDRLPDADREFEALARTSIAGPDKSMLRVRLALLRSRQQRHDEAIALAQSAAEELRTHPSNEVQAATDKARGTVLLAAGHPAEAIAALERAVQVYSRKRVTVAPDHAEALEALTRARGAHAVPADSTAAR